MLHLLVEYAKRNDGSAPPGFEEEYVRWLLQFDSDGTYRGATRRGHDKGKGDLFVVPRLTQPEMKVGGAGTRHFLCDRAEWVLGICGRMRVAEEEDRRNGLKLRARVRANRKSFINNLREASSATGVGALSNIADALDRWRVLRRIRAQLENRDTPLKRTDNVTFFVCDLQPPLLIESESWHDWYRNFRRKLGKKASARQMVSFASGEPVTPAKTHLKIGHLSRVGGLQMGDALASFKQDAFRHFGLEQSENAAVSEEEAAAYRTGLESLIRDRSRNLANALITYWYSGPAAKSLHEHPNEDPIEPLLPMPSHEDESPEGVQDSDPTTGEQAELHQREEAQARSRLVKLLDAIRSGQRPELLKTRFYALCLAANSGRVVVRDWIEGDFAALAEQVRRWIDDLSIVSIESADAPHRAPKLEALITCVLPPRRPGQKYDDWVRPAGKLREPIFRQAIGLGAHQVLGEAARILLPRWQADVLGGNFDKALQGPGPHLSTLQARVSLLKAFVIRQGVAMEPCLFEDHPDPAYHCGRLLAVLADVQRTALGDVGAGVVQRYYARASTAPADALGPLISLSNRHLDKIADKRLAFHLQDKIAEIWGKFSAAYPPKTLDTIGQSLFAMGFYQQIAHMRHERRANATKRKQLGQQPSPPAPRI